ncbi:MAG: hypothetical protein IKV02_00755, partial [Clostridia bacterium]|nr:hypothetical protein [Clostridia bacterium]
YKLLFCSVGLHYHQSPFQHKNKKTPVSNFETGVKYTRGTTQIATMSPLSESNNSYALTQQLREILLSFAFEHPARK